MAAGSEGEGPRGAPPNHLRQRATIHRQGMTDVRTSPYCPQSKGKIERWHKSLKGECIRPGTPLTPDDTRRPLQQCHRLHDAERHARRASA